MENKIDLNGRRTRGVAIAALAMLFLSGCGASQTAPQSSSLSSYGGGDLLTSANATINGVAAAECTGFSATGYTLNGRITTFYPNGSSGGPSPDTVRLQLRGVGAELDPAATGYIKMYRWKASTSTAPYLDTNPLSFQVVRASNGTILMQTRTSLSGADMTNLRSSLGLSTSTSASDVLAQTILIVANVDYDWQAIKIALYNSSDSAVAEVDALLPAFLANPNSYLAAKPLVLGRLHPFYSQRSDSAATDSTWQSRSIAYCF